MTLFLKYQYYNLFTEVKERTTLVTMSSHQANGTNGLLERAPLSKYNYIFLCMM